MLDKRLLSQFFMSIPQFVDSLKLLRAAKNAQEKSHKFPPIYPTLNIFISELEFPTLVYGQF